MMNDAEEVRFPQEAPCAETDPEMFFAEERQDPRNPNKIVSVYRNEKGAKAVCFSCEYRFECLQLALEENLIGIWGGTTENERRNIKRGRRSKIEIL
jgi:WhiB family redox-sensing transcriptional regulator